MRAGAAQRAVGAGAAGAQVRRRDWCRTAPPPAPRRTAPCRRPRGRAAAARAGGGRPPTAVSQPLVRAPACHGRNSIGSGAIDRFFAVGAHVATRRHQRLEPGRGSQRSTASDVAGGVDDAEALRLPPRARQVRRPRTRSKNSPRSLSKRSGPSSPLRRAARAMPAVDRRIEQQRQVGLQARVDDADQRVDIATGRPRPPPWYAYVASVKRSQRTQAPRASAGLDEVVEVRGARREHQQQLAGLRASARAPRSSTMARSRSASGVPPGSRVGDHLEAAAAQPGGAALQLRATCRRPRRLRT